MVLNRVMPCLLLRGGALVKTVRFRAPAYIGDPVNAVKIYNEKEVDELVLLDVEASRQGRGPDLATVLAVASECFMPLAVGGGVRTLADFEALYARGVEKVVVNTLLLRAPETVAEAVREFGSSSVVASIDVRRGWRGTLRVHSASGAPAPRDAAEHARHAAETVGVGEILLASVDRDGTWAGYDLDAVRAVAAAVRVPVVASGGAGSVADVRALFETTPATGAALGSLAVYQKRGMGVLISFPPRAALLGPDV